MADINLLPKEEKASERVVGLQRQLTILSFVVLLFVALSLLVTLYFFTSSASQLKDLNSKISADVSNINSQQEKEELLTVVKKKVSAGDKIASDRLDQTKIFSAFSSLVPNNVYFSSVAIDAGKVSLSGKAKTSLDMSGFVSSLVNEQGTKYFTNVNISSLSSDRDGVYTFGMTMDIIKSKDTQTD